ncbi:hypothetical protein FQR65_LT14548 [Abscondita terminalis]|nr:hypothetical protein FQR65_LT14548 [Abscondita terminalis]
MWIKQKFFLVPELFETSSAKAVVDSDLLKEANEYFATGHSSVKKNYVELKNFTVSNSENEEIISSNTATLNNPDTLLDLNTNSDGIEIIPTEDTVVEQIEIQSDYLNVDRECAEEVLDIDKENKNGQEENLDFNNTNKHKKTDHKDLKHPKKTKKRYEPQLLETCKRSCRQNCYERFNDNERKIIFRNYNDLNFREKRLFLDKHIVKNDIKYRKVDANVPRRFSIIYNLPNVKIKSRPENILSDSQSKTNIIIEDVVNVNSLDVEPLLVENFPDSQSETKSMIVVCKSMFMNTLGLRSDSIITDYLKRTINDLPVDLKDKRGQKRAETVRAIAEKNYTDIKNHINSYHPQVSHYNLEHAPNRRYLPCDITIRDMYKDFIEKVYKISYETYRKVFDKENIGFASPTQDECGMCSTYKNHAHENAPTNSTSTVCEEPGQTKITICDICKKYDIHKIRYTVARKQYNEDSSKKWTSDFEIFSVDMQKILILPKMTIKNSFFVSRLVVIHETFANLQAGHENKCVLWHEAIRGRNGPDVVSAFYNVLKRLNNHTKHVIFWADNCTAQNKNWTLYTSCVIFVNELWGPDTITFKQKWKHTPEVLDYEDLVHLIESSNKLNKVVNLRVEDFLEFENGCQTRKKGSELPKLNDLNGKTYEVILNACKSIQISITPEEVDAIENCTQNQAQNFTWFKYRAGRITASKFKSVSRARLEKPPISLIKGICYPAKMIFHSKQTTYGIKNEKRHWRKQIFLDDIRNLTSTTIRELRAFVDEGLPIRTLGKRKYRLHNKRVKEATTQFLISSDVGEFLNMLININNGMLDNELTNLQDIEDVEQLLTPLSSDVPAEFSIGFVGDNREDIEVVPTNMIRNQDSHLCIICKDEQPTTILMPCKHFGLCDQCSREMRKRNETHSGAPRNVAWRGLLKKLNCMQLLKFLALTSGNSKDAKIDNERTDKQDRKIDTRETRDNTNANVRCYRCNLLVHIGKYLLQHEMWTPRK